MPWPSGLARESILQVLLSSFVLVVLSQQSVRAQEKHAPEGVRFLQNKSFDDSDQARRAREINSGDQQSRRGRYQRLGIPPDETVKDK